MKTWRVFTFYFEDGSGNVLFANIAGENVKHAFTFFEKEQYFLGYVFDDLSNFTLEKTWVSPDNISEITVRHNSKYARPLFYKVVTEGLYA